MSTVREELILRERKVSQLDAQQRIILAALAALAALAKALGGGWSGK